jgi:transcriptional regulator with XRE-family HTH domain
MRETTTQPWVGVDSVATGSSGIPEDPADRPQDTRVSLYRRSAIMLPMRGNHLVREARRRAHLTQAELARRADTTQSVIARVEAGATGPSLEYISRLVRACGYDLGVRLVPADDHDWTIAVGNLALTPSQRVAKLKDAVRFAEAGQRARQRATAGATGER